MAAACETSDGVVYVPAALGLGTPDWDYGARGTLLGITDITFKPGQERLAIIDQPRKG